MKEFFQKDGLHIVDIARIISQNVTFEMYTPLYIINSIYS